MIKKTNNLINYVATEQCHLSLIILQIHNKGLYQNGVVYYIIKIRFIDKAGKLPESKNKVA